MSYVCVSLDANGVCTEWAQAITFTALSYEDGAALAATIIGCWAVAFGARMMFLSLLNR